MKKKTIVTNQMKYDYSAKVVFQLYMQKLVTQDEYKSVLVQLMDHYKVTGTSQESNAVITN